MIIFHLYSTILYVCYLSTIVSTLNFGKATKDEVVVVRKVDTLLNQLLQNILVYVRNMNDTSLDWARIDQKDADLGVDHKLPDVNGIRPMPQEENANDNDRQEVIPLNQSSIDETLPPPIVASVENGIKIVTQSSNSKQGNNFIVFPSIDVPENNNKQSSTSHDQGIKQDSQLPNVHGDRFPKWLRPSPMARRLYVIAQEAKRANDQ